MGLGRGDVLAVESLVEVDGGVDLLHDGVGARRKSSAPHFVAHGSALRLTAKVPPFMPENPPSSAGKRYLAKVVTGAIVGVAIGLAGVYGIATLTGNAGGDAANDATCRPAVALAKKLAPLAHGEVAAVNVATKPLKLPDLSF